jgi:hypothetical protein
MNDSANATKLRRRSLFHMPIVLCCLIVCIMSTTQLVPQTQLVQGFASQPLLAPSHTQPKLFRKQQSTQMKENILDRFTSPKIEDPVLPLTEAGIAQIVAPTIQLFWLTSLRSPLPSWTTPLYDITFLPRGYLLAPTLIHGAGLACCWLLGSLAARGFEREAYEGDLKTVLSSTARAGAFATGLLILGTQIDLYHDMGGYVQIGDSAETDLRIYRALVEIVNDVFFEAITLFSWRAFRSKVDN